MHISTSPPSVHDLQVRVPLPREGLGAPRHPGHPAVQAQRVCQPDQPEHGERLGHPALRHRHLSQAGRGQVPHPQGPQQGEDFRARRPLASSSALADDWEQKALL